MKKIILASQSPRRSEILKKAFYDFVSIPTHVSEIPDKNLNTNEQIIDIARRKAKSCEALIHDLGLASFDFPVKMGLIVAADTMVCVEEQILGKPETTSMAFDFLKSLSGKTHQVKTAVFVINLQTLEEVSLIETTDVTFRVLSDHEILTYIATGEPMDKAGAYAIQGEGRKLVKDYQGDFDNVVGLPLQAIEKLFKIKSWTCSRSIPEIKS